VSSPVLRDATVLEPRQKIVAQIKTAPKRFRNAIYANLTKFVVLAESLPRRIGVASAVVREDTDGQIETLATNY
jgi:hypothetical protein